MKTTDLKFTVQDMFNLLRRWADSTESTIIKEDTEKYIESIEEKIIDAYVEQELLKDLDAYVEDPIFELMREMNIKFTKLGPTKIEISSSELDKLRPKGLDPSLSTEPFIPLNGLAYGRPLEIIQVD